MYYGDPGKYLLVVAHLVLLLIPLVFAIWFFLNPNVLKDKREEVLLAILIASFAAYGIKGHAAISYLDVVLRGRSLLVYSGVVENVVLERGHRKKVEMLDGTTFLYEYNSDYCSKGEWNNLLYKSAALEISYFRFFFKKNCFVDISELQ